VIHEACDSVWQGHSTGTYVLVDNTLIATDWTGLTGGALQHATKDNSRLGGY
jgi:hypothetical protein